MLLFDFTHVFLSCIFFTPLTLGKWFLKLLVCERGDEQSFIRSEQYVWFVCKPACVSPERSDSSVRGQCPVSSEQPHVKTSSAAHMVHTLLHPVVDEQRVSAAYQEHWGMSRLPLATQSHSVNQSDELIVFSMHHFVVNIRKVVRTPDKISRSPKVSISAACFISQLSLWQHTESESSNDWSINWLVDW